MTRGPFFSIFRRIDIGRPLSVKIVKEDPRGDAIGCHLEELGMVDKNMNLAAALKNSWKDFMDKRGLRHQPLFGRNGGHRTMSLRTK